MTDGGGLIPLLARAVHRVSHFGGLRPLHGDPDNGVEDVAAALPEEVLPVVDDGDHLEINLIKDLNKLFINLIHL